MTLKVKPLEHYMRYDPEDFPDDFVKVSPFFELIGRDGYYMSPNWNTGTTEKLAVWFEVNGIGYKAFPRYTRKIARANFEYDLKVCDGNIIPEKEAKAMIQVLKTSRDFSVKKVLQERLRLHKDSLSLRSSYRSGRMLSLKFLKN